VFDSRLNDPLFDNWLAHLESRHLSVLTFSEVSRALRALSAIYVGNRGRLAEGAALSGAGKRAAFALFYGPLHFLLVRAIVHALPDAIVPVPVVVDVGCGTGAAGAAWGAACFGTAQIMAIDKSAWALEEAADTYRAFGLRARTIRRDTAQLTLPKPPAVMVAAFSLNELEHQAREELMSRMFARGRAERRVLVVEPLARGAAPWWNRWRERVVALGGRADEWRFRIERPAIIEKLDRAASLDHRELTGRSLYLSTRP